ncbi:MAG TPA: GNAT family N-acetyltransferase [Rhizomicrobium sp.]|jgi:putative acetyltransferase
MLPDDAPLLAAIFRASIEELTGDYYTDAQQDAWMSAADDEEGFGARLAGDLTILALLDREPVGFASLRDNNHIQMLYVAPGAARRGVGTALVSALEALAAARGTNIITADASDSARALFIRLGYTALHRNTVSRGGEWLGNTAMQKALSPLAKGTLQ